MQFNEYWVKFKERNGILDHANIEVLSLGIDDSRYVMLSYNVLLHY